MSENLNQELANTIIEGIEKTKLLRAQEVKTLKDKFHSAKIKEEDWFLYIENAVEAEAKVLGGEKK